MYKMLLLLFLLNTWFFFMRSFMYYELLLKFWRYESWLNFKRLHFILIISVFLSMMNACISEKSPITTVWQSSPNNYDTIFPDSQCFPYTLPLSSSYMLPSFINTLYLKKTKINLKFFLPILFIPKHDLLQVVDEILMPIKYISIHPTSNMCTMLKHLCINVQVQN